MPSSSSSLLSLFKYTVKYISRLFFLLRVLFFFSFFTQNKGGGGRGRSPRVNFYAFLIIFTFFIVVDLLYFMKGASSIGITSDVSFCVYFT